MSKILKVYTDASPSKFVIGAGIKILGPDQIKYEVGVPVKPGLSTNEAEMYSLLIGIDQAKSVIASHGLRRKVDVEFFIDCDPVIKGLFDQSTFRAASARTLKEKVKKALHSAGKSHFKTWKIQPVRSAVNPADRIAKAARQRWRDIWKSASPRGPSGRSS